MTTIDRDRARPVVERVVASIQASPSPYHAAERAAEVLGPAGFERRARHEIGRGPAEGRFLCVVGGSVVAWVHGGGPVERFVIVGAHTDSPNLRLRPTPELANAGWSQLAVETYGGLLGNSWLDRDLGIAGRLVLDDGDTVLLWIDEPIARIPQLAIHLDREISSDGLKLDPQNHLMPLWAVGEAGDPGSVLAELCGRAGIDPGRVAASDLMFADTLAPAVVGRDRDLLASPRIDNQVSCFAAVEALAAVDPETLPAGTAAVLVLNDHEEVGSSSYTGAAGNLLAPILEQVGAAAGGDRADHLAALAASAALSLDGAHAVHPNYAAKHEPNHRPLVNRGVVLKHNNNQRYATDAPTAAWVRRAATSAGIELQDYSHRNDLPCGSTIGPITATVLGIPTADAGAPMLAMHSIRELCGLDDIADLAALAGAAWATDSPRP